MEPETAERPGLRSKRREKAKAAWRRLRGGELTPSRAAWSVAVGLAVGVTPLWGLHLVMVLSICLPLSLDVPLAYFAANISIPVIAPFLTMAELEIGSFVLTHHGLPGTFAEIRSRGLGLFARELLVGTVAFSPSIGLVGGGLAYAVVRGARGRAAPAKRVSPLDEAIGRVAARYAERAGRATYHYVRGKLAGDPVARRIAELGASAPLGDVLDVGCGRGQVSVLLLELGVATRARGFDWDGAKVAEARRASHALDASFEVGDLREIQRFAEECDTALLLDVLHYLDAADQDRTLRAAARAARRTVVVRELDPERGWRSAVTRIQEGLTTGTRYNRGARVHVQPVRALARTLTEEGFSVEVTPCWGRTPFSNVLLVARRVSRSASVEQVREVARADRS